MNKYILLAAFPIIGLALPPAEAGVFRSTESMNTARYGHTATQLANGQVLVAGGFDTNELASAELYDPATGHWTRTGPLNIGRSGHTGTLLPDGKVLVVGGSTNHVAIATAEFYEPVTGKWVSTGVMASARSFGHTATLLANGKVLVAGGEVVTSTNDLSLAVAELYDPITGSWTKTGPMNVARSGHSGFLLPNGKVLVVGGSPYQPGGVAASGELYDPETGTWSKTGTLNLSRVGVSATLLLNGTVLTAGGYYSFSGSDASAEVFDPATSQLTETSPLNTARAFHAATLLPNGRVLVVGGQGTYFNNSIPLPSPPLRISLSSAEEYDATTGKWASTGGTVSARDFGHTATLLANGQVLVAGGFHYEGSSSSVGSSLSSAELYDPAQGGTWTSAGSLANGRQLHTATVLTNGQVLVAGGSAYTAPSTSPSFPAPSVMTPPLAPGL
jgi:hypothetical protein